MMTGKGIAPWTVLVHDRYNIFFYNSLGRNGESGPWAWRALDKEVYLSTYGSRRVSDKLAGEINQALATLAVAKEQAGLVMFSYASDDILEEVES